MQSFNLSYGRVLLPLLTIAQYSGASSGAGEQQRSFNLFSYTPAGGKAPAEGKAGYHHDVISSLENINVYHRPPILDHMNQYKSLFGNLLQAITNKFSFFSHRPQEPIVRYHVINPDEEQEQQNYRPYYEKPPRHQSCAALGGRKCPLDGKCYANIEVGTFLFSQAEAACARYAKGAKVFMQPIGATYDNFYKPCIGQTSANELTTTAWVGPKPPPGGQCTLVFIDVLTPTVNTAPSECETSVNGALNLVYCEIPTGYYG